MLKIELFQVDAFSAVPLKGNPAAVCPLSEFLPDELLQAVARENNLSETAFIVSDGPGRYGIRWFTPTQEVDLCGHATLAAAHVVFQFLEPALNSVLFCCSAGDLHVWQEGAALAMRFPRWQRRPVERSQQTAAALGVNVLEIFEATDVVAVVGSEEEVLAVQPDFTRLIPLSRRGVTVTAPGAGVDYVSRSFFPRIGVLEDPVCGSVHCALAPYWSERLQRLELSSRTLSIRTGELRCRLEPQHVVILGCAALYLQGRLFLPQCDRD